MEETETGVQRGVYRLCTRRESAITCGGHACTKWRLAVSRTRDRLLDRLQVACVIALGESFAKILFEIWAAVPSRRSGSSPSFEHFEKILCFVSAPDAAQRLPLV